MSFITRDFLIFFTALFSVYFFIPNRFRWILLLVSSYFFYGYYNIKFLPFLIIPTLISWMLSKKISSMEDSSKRRYLFYSLLAISLAPLLIFKYSDFTLKTVHSIRSLFTDPGTYESLKLILPIGISYYTFKLVSYAADIYNRKLCAEKHAGYFALYVAFFPQLFMGPIDRAVNFIPELKKKVEFNSERISSGFTLILWGIFKKLVIADRLSIFVNEVFKSPEGYGLNLIFGAYFYAFQIYCDFSGYTDIAIGLSRILGFKSMDNFNYPYTSKNITQFWNKWHISLSTWLRDYLFLPLAYATMRRVENNKFLGIKTETWSYTVGMSITMFLGGLWHGASWTMVTWGIIHGIFLVFSFLTKKKRKKFVKKTGLKKHPLLHSGISVFITFNMVTLAWIFFRAPSFQNAVNYLSEISLKPVLKGLHHVIFNIVLILIFLCFEKLYKNRKEIKMFINMNVYVKTVLYTAFICLIIIFSADITNEFIYFQF